MDEELAATIRGCARAALRAGVIARQRGGERGECPCGRYIAYPTDATRRYVPQWITVMRRYMRTFYALPEGYESEGDSEGSVKDGVDDEVE